MQGDALLHTQETPAAQARRLVEYLLCFKPFAIIFDDQVDLWRFDTQVHLHGGGFCMFDDIGNRFLRDPEQNRLAFRRWPDIVTSFYFKMSLNRITLFDFGEIPAEGGNQTKIVEMGWAQVGNNLSEFTQGLRTDDTQFVHLGDGDTLFLDQEAIPRLAILTRGRSGIGHWHRAARGQCVAAPPPAHPRPGEADWPVVFHDPSPLCSGERAR